MYVHSLQEKENEDIIGVEGNKKEYEGRRIYTEQGKQLSRVWRDVGL